jgi:hypothetical protein
MSALAEMSNGVETGAISCVNIVAVPRSVSTAFGRALNETPQDSAFINEPFNSKQHDAEAVAEVFLGSLTDIADDTKQLLITKNMAGYLGVGNFVWLDELAETTVWVVRNPLVQMGSLLTRLANDEFVARGSDELSQSDLGPYMDELCQILDDSHRSRDFSKTGWASLAILFERRASHKHQLVIDGDNFQDNPSGVLHSVCTESGIPYSEQMVHGWQSTYRNMPNGDSSDETQASAWTSEAATSTEIRSSPRQPLELEELPALLRKHMEEVAIPTYDHLLSS